MDEDLLVRAEEEKLLEWVKPDVSEVSMKELTQGATNIGLDGGSYS